LARLTKRVPARIKDKLGQSAVALTDVIFFLNFVPGHDQAHRALNAIIEILIILDGLATNCCNRTEDAASSARAAGDTILLPTTRLPADAKMRSILFSAWRRSGAGLPFGSRHET
jgi:hypothetical protein